MKGGTVEYNLSLIKLIKNKTNWFSGQFSNNYIDYIRNDNIQIFVTLKKFSPCFYFRPFRRRCHLRI